MTTTDQELIITEAADLGPLTTTEQADLARCETAIERGMQTFIEVGEALAEIKEAHLYRASHGTWGAYIAQRWPEIGGRRQADRLIGAAEVAADLGPMGPIVTNERQARPLLGLSSEDRRQAVQQAVQQAPDGRPTARQIEEAAKAVKPPKAIPLPELPADLAAAGWRLRPFGTAGQYDAVCARGEATSPDWPAAVIAAARAIEQRRAGGEEEIAQAPVPPGSPAGAGSLPPALAVPAAAVPPPLLTPLTPVAPAAPDLAARKLLEAKYQLLDQVLLLVDAELRQLPPGPRITIPAAASIPAARLFVAGPALGGAASMLTFSAVVIDAELARAEPPATTTPEAAGAQAEHALRIARQLNDLGSES